MGTAMSYIVLAACVVAGAYYYNPDQFKRVLDSIFGQPQQTVTPDITQTSKRTKPRRDKQEAPTTKTPKIISEPVSVEVKAKISDGKHATLPRVENDDMDNAEFAKQLKQAQQGTRLQPREQQVSSKKSRRHTKTQQRAPAANGELESTETSSNGGRDGDDDMSPADTPPSSVSRAGDISDMLEPATPKVSSIKLTNTEASQPKATAPKQFEAAQTKKQRQRQKQNEENRKLREESDKQHAAKMHKQIHSARTLEGTSKQGKASTFTQNAWQGKPAQPQEQPEKPAQLSLLDTFDPNEASTKSSVTVRQAEDIVGQSQVNVKKIREEIGEQKTQALAGSERERPQITHKESWADQLNADAQDQWAKNLVEEQQWESVTTKKGKKKTKKDNETSSEASQSAAGPPPFLAPQKPAIAGNGTSNGSTAIRPQSMNRFDSVAGDEWEA